MATPSPILVRANFRFRGMNNDELNFKKGDVITVTQQIDGGWWEGSFNGKTGWFPSNYVTPTGAVASCSSASVGSLPVVEETQVNGHAAKDPGGAVGDDDSVGLASSLATSAVQNDAASHQLKDFPTRKRESMILYHNVVLDNIIDSEAAFVADMRALISSVLIPLRLRCGSGAEEKLGEVSSSLPNNHVASDVADVIMSTSLPLGSPLTSFARNLSSEEVSKLGGNLDDILAFHQELLRKLEEIKHLPIHEQRVGGLFLSGAPKAKALYEIYFANHPSAIDVLMQRKEELTSFLEQEVGVTPPGDLYLTQSLSSVFRRLEKYPTLFKELERYLEEFHADRGDTQRAFSVYQDILLRCHHIRHMRALELEVLVHPFRSPSPVDAADERLVTINGWRGDGELRDLGPVVLLSEVHVLNLKKLKDEVAFRMDNNNEIIMSSHFSATQSTVTEDGTSSSLLSVPLSEGSSATLVSNDAFSETPLTSESSPSTPTSRSNAIPIPGASPSDGESSVGIIVTNGLDASPQPNPETGTDQSSSTASTLVAKKQFLLLYPSALLVLSVSPCMKQFVLDCRFDGDASGIVAKIIPASAASSMLLDAEGAMYDSMDSSTVSSFPPQNALELSNLPGMNAEWETKLNAIFTSKIDRDVWLEQHTPPPLPMQDSGLSALSQGTSISSPSSGVTPSSSPIPPPPASSPSALGTASSMSTSLTSYGESDSTAPLTQGAVVAPPIASFSELDSLCATQPSPAGANHNSSPPPTLVPITNIPPPHPYNHTFRPQEFSGKPPAPPPPAISPHPPPLPPPPSSYSIMLSAAAAANNQEIIRSGLTTQTNLHSDSQQSPIPTSSQSQPHSPLPVAPLSPNLPKSATLPADPAPSFVHKAATLPARLNRAQSSKQNQHLSRPPVIPIHHPQWTLSCLRPNPPVRPNLGGPSAQTGLPFVSLRNGDGSNKLLATTKGNLKKSSEDGILDEAEILRVIEAYCTTVKARNTVNSTLLDSPQVLIAEEEKIIVEERKGNQLVVEEKTLVDTVYALKDQVSDIMEQMKTLRTTLDYERKARKRMEMTIRKTLKNGQDSTTNASLTASVVAPPSPALPPPLPSQPPPSAPPPSVSVNDTNDSNAYV